MMKKKQVMDIENMDDLFQNNAGSLMQSLKVCICVFFPPWFCFAFLCAPSWRRKMLLFFSLPGFRNSYLGKHLMALTFGVFVHVSGRGRGFWEWGVIKSICGWKLHVAGWQVQKPYSVKEKSVRSFLITPPQMGYFLFYC